MWKQDEDMHFPFAMFWRSDFMLGKPGTLFFVNVLLELDPGHIFLTVSQPCFYCYRWNTGLLMCQFSGLENQITSYKWHRIRE